MSKRRVVLLPGDGIGPEVVEAARRVVEAAGLAIEWVPREMGAVAFEKYGDALPADVIDEIRRCGVALKGPTTTPIAKGYTSANVRLRKELGLFANVRPVKTVPGLETPYGPTDLVIVRENTESLYAGMENEVAPGVVTSIKVITETASRRIAKFAFEYALEWDRKRVTAVHKANIMKMADGLFLECARQESKPYEGRVKFDDVLVDALAMKLVTKPSQFDVLLLENLYGDIVSDLAAGLIGGLGLAPGANYGPDCAVFEAIHGSAPDIAGKGIANPIAMILSAAMMCHHLGDNDASLRIRKSVRTVTTEHRELLTPDLGGKGTTRSITDAIVREVERRRSEPVDA
ncbi:MAG TPA: isocitrate/isopropylmalate dehydrogenase family protein [Candidatus Krumholzibacteria bacterium]|nr:isocitrate/isopropylmalate dehydrogenase family protein [Candidatus Krumholzibacteria bacterium]